MGQGGELDTGERSGDRLARRRSCYVYVFPSLFECRKDFREMIQGGIDWEVSKGGVFAIDERNREPPPDR